MGLRSQHLVRIESSMHARQVRTSPDRKEAVLPINRDRYEDVIFDHVDRRIVHTSIHIRSALVRARPIVTVQPLRFEQLPRQWFSVRGLPNALLFPAVVMDEFQRYFIPCALMRQGGPQCFHFTV